MSFITLTEFNWAYPSASMSERFSHRVQMILEAEEDSACILSSGPMPYTYENISTMISQRCYLEIKVTTSNWISQYVGCSVWHYFLLGWEKSGVSMKAEGAVSSIPEDRRAQLSLWFHHNRVFIYAFHWQFLWKLVKVESTAHSRW